MADTRKIENHKEEVPFSHYVELFRSLDPQEAAARTGAAFDGAAFTLHLVDTDYRIYWPEYRIEAKEGAFALKYLPAQTFLLRYLLEGKAVKATGEFKTFREMPWGELYIQPFTGRCLTRAAFTFATKIPKFCAAMEKLGATKLPHGDAGYQLELLPGFAMQISSGQGMMSSRPALKSSTRTTSPADLHRRIGWWRGI